MNRDSALTFVDVDDTNDNHKGNHKEEKYGNMVGLQNNRIVPVPLSEVAGKLKKIPVDCDLI